MAVQGEKRAETRSFQSISLHKYQIHPLPLFTTSDQIFYFKKMNSKEARSYILKKYWSSKHVCLSIYPVVMATTI